MAEESLGSAVLQITVDTTSALQQLSNFQKTAGNALQSIQVGIDATQGLAALQQQAKAAGTKAGNAISASVKAATSKLKFENIKEALSFDGALSGTLADLREYKRALEELREVTKTSAPGFRELNDRISELGIEIKNETRSTGELTRALQQMLDASSNQKIKEAAEAHRDAAKAARDQAKANKELRESYIGVAKGAANFAGQTAGVVSKGIRGAIGLGKGAINAGRAGYDIGAELGIFEAPKDGPLKASINSIIERFRFLGEQATTARGQILRLIEGAGAAEAFNQIAQNADLLRASLDGVRIASKATEGVLGGLSKLGQFAADITPDIGPLSALKDLLQDAANLEKLAAGAAGGGDFFAQFGAEAGKAAIDQIETLSNMISMLPPELAAVAGGVLGVYAAFEGDNAFKQLQEIANGLKRVGTEALNVDKALTEIFESEARKVGKGPLALPSSEILANRVRADGQGLPQRLDAGSFNSPLEAQSRALGEQVSEGQRLAAAEALRTQNQVELNALLEQGLGVFRTTVDVVNEQAEAQRRITQELQAQAAEADRIRANEQRASDAAKKRLREQAQERKDRAASGADNLLAADRGTRLSRFGRSLPEPRQRSRAERANDAIGSALIGGAFPLLFGQGLGASVGGGVGGALGGLKGGQFGFGLSLVGTLIGSQVDAAVQNLSKLGGALQDPIGKFGELAEAGLFSSKSMEKNIESLIASGREAEAAAQIQLDLARTYGQTDDLVKLNSALGELGGAFAKLGAQMLTFIAGPLSDFLGKLAQSTGFIAQGQGFDKRIGDLGLNTNERTAIIDQARAEAKAIGDLSELYTIANRLIDEQYGKTEDVIAAEAALAAATARRIEQDKIAVDLTEAQLNGREQEILALQRRELLLQRADALAAAPAEQQDAITRKFDAQIRELDSKQRRLTRDRYVEEISFINRLADLKEQTEIEGRRRELTGTGIGALETLREVENARRAQEEALARSRATPGSTELQNAAFESTRALELSSAKAKNDLLDAFDAAKDAVRTISRSLEDAKLQLGELQNTTQSGLNQFLPAQQISERQAALGDRLRPLANSIAKQLGITLSLSGTREQVNAKTIEFIRSFRAEQRLNEDIFDTRQDLDRATNDLAEVNRGLLTVNGELTSATQALANKDWSVYVSVPGAEYSASSRLQGVYN